METGNNSSMEMYSNSSTDKTPYAEHVYYHFVVPIIFGLISVTGVIGNSLVIFVILTKQQMRTVTNLLLLNLAIADLAFIIVVPPLTAYIFADGVVSRMTCVLIHYLTNVTAYITVYTLVLISTVRYATIVHNSIWSRETKNIILPIVCIWILMPLLNIPIFFSFGGRPEDPCGANSKHVARSVYSTFFVFAYLFPLCIIAMLSIAILRHITRQKLSMLNKQKKSDDRKKQASRLLILVVVIFAIVWLPAQIHLLVAAFHQLPTVGPYAAVSVFWNCLAYCNSCVNPIIYNSTSKEFRDSFKAVICCNKTNNDARYVAAAQHDEKAMDRDNAPTEI